MSTPLRVLVVEDSRDNATLLVRTLSKGGYEPTWEQVETAAAMAAALDRQPWDLVISDYVLPQFSALDALRLLQERDLDLPFFVVSGLISEEMAAAAMKAGAHDYLMKDNLTRLVPAIERELREAHDRHMRRRMKQELHKRTERFQVLLGNALDLIMVLAPDGTVRYGSPSSEHVLGYQPETLAGANVLPYVHADDRPVVQETLRLALQQPGIAHPVKFRFLSREGMWRVLVASGTSLLEEGEIAGVVMNARDVTESEAQTAALRYHVLYDTLTGLPNRASFQDTLTQALCAAQGKGKRLALLYIDLDRFRDINDTFGHHWGDIVLQQVGPRLQSILRKSDAIARLSGDEFAVLLQTVSDLAGATRIAQRILQVLEPPFVVEGQSLDIGASIGTVLYPEHGTDAETLMRRADMAMYIAKRTGNGYACYTADQEDQYNPNRLVLMSELRQAIEQAQLTLLYQPKAEITSGCVTQVEALARWLHPQRGLLPPDQFIPVAEQTGLIKSISRWVLNEALRQCCAWHQEGLDLHVAVNLSMRDLQDAQLPSIIARLLETWEIAPTCLEVEITETAIAADLGRTLETLGGLRHMGVHITIDDFGTGYSSLAHLKRLPVDAIKIDKSFVLDMTIDENDAAIVRSTIDLGHNLGLTVVAEGVENRATWDALAALGCDFAQGYYLSRPLAAADLKGWLRESSWQEKASSVIPLSRTRKWHRV